MINSSKPVELLAKHLKSHGYSLTKPRRVLFEVLLLEDALSMHDLTAKLNTKLDRASIYRNVALFEELGIVQRLYMGWKYKVELSDAFLAHHHHLHCVGCGTITSFSDTDAVEQLIAQTAQVHGFSPIKHNLEIEGYCQKCQKTFTPQQQAVPHAHHNHTHNA